MYLEVEEEENTEEKEEKCTRARAQSGQLKVTAVGTVEAVLKTMFSRRAV